LRALLNLLKEIVLGVILAPLNAIMIVIASLHILINILLYRYKRVMNDIRSVIPITIHKFKMWKRYRKRGK